MSGSNKNDKAKGASESQEIMQGVCSSVPRFNTDLKIPMRIKNEPTDENMLYQHTT